MNLPENQIRLVKEVSGFIGRLTREGQRAAVIIGAARIDAAVERLLKSELTNNPDGQDNLFDPDRPLGTFSAKISLAYRLKLFDDEVESALQMIRKIRNAFAHGHEDVTLDSGIHQSRLVELRRLTEQMEFRKAIREAIRLTDKGVPESLLQFATSAAAILLVLEIAVERNDSTRHTRRELIHEATFRSAQRTNSALHKETL